tara:strand:- start:873 stop:1322 length:450 start_codon:yes stop_codon:yes gene_type:complete
MARYISYKEQDGTKSWSRLHSTDASKNWWLERDPTSLTIQVNEEEFTKLKHGYLISIDSSNNLVLNLEGDTSDSIQITEEEVITGLQEHIKKMEKHIVNHEIPLWSQSDVDYLKAIDTSTITWPVTSTPKPWNEILEINSILIDTIYEV